MNKTKLSGSDFMGFTAWLALVYLLLVVLAVIAFVKKPVIGRSSSSVA